MERPSPRGASTPASPRYSDASGSPRTTASDGKKEKKQKKDKKDKKDKEARRAQRRSVAPGVLGVAANRAALDIGTHEADLLLRRLNDLSMLTAESSSTPLSSPAVARVLCDAVDSDRMDVAVALIMLGVDPNALHPLRNVTALTVAAEKGDAEAINDLIAVGAKIMVQGQRESPLQAAERARQMHALRLLRSKT